jgi:hypothetical protein
LLKRRVMTFPRASFAPVLASIFALVACGGSEGSDHPSSDSAVDSGSSDAPPGDTIVSDTNVGDSNPGDTIVTDTTPDTPADTTPRVPKQHRPSASTCAPSTGTGGGICGGGGGPPGSCKSDADCTAGTNGHCDISGGGALICMCFYDTCANDSDCTTGGPCACQGTPYQAQSNNCAPGNCKVDADCGAGGFCSPSEGTTGCSGGLDGYFCHTAADECIDDTDCPTSSGPKVCNYDKTKAHWVCSDLLLCG